MSVRKSNNRIEVCLNDDEMNALENLKTRTGLSTTAIFRNLITNTPIIERVDIDYTKVYTELNRIGKNINQLTQIAHTTKSINSVGLLKCKDELKLITAYLNEALKGY